MADLTKIQEVRDRDESLHIEGYCRNRDCAARESEIRIKDYDETLLSMLRDRGGLHCPACGSPLAIHSVQTSYDHRQWRQREARGNVAVQMYARDQGDDFIAVPASVFMDSRLPPTPEGWWHDLLNTPQSNEEDANLP